MRFLADENLDWHIVRALRSHGHEVFYIAEMAPGMKDDEVLRLAHAQSAVLVTGDKDFGALVFERGLSHAGVVLVRLHGWSPDKKAEEVLALLTDHQGEMQGAFTVLDERGVRTRFRSEGD